MPGGLVHEEKRRVRRAKIIRTFARLKSEQGGINKTEEGSETDPEGGS